jgi:hypothetical protein
MHVILLGAAGEIGDPLDDGVAWPGDDLIPAVTFLVMAQKQIIAGLTAGPVEG